MADSTKIEYKTSGGVNLYIIFIVLFSASFLVTVWNAMQESKVRKVTMKNEKLRSEILQKELERVSNT